MNSVMRLLYHVVIVGTIGILLACWIGEIEVTPALEKDNTLSDPCLFLKGEGDFHYIRDRQDRERFGYRKQIPLSKAIELFNEEQKCYSHRAEPLSEDEVVAAVSAGNDYGGTNIFSEFRTDLELIVKERVMPRGSLLVGEGDALFSDRFVKGDYFIKGQRIYLFLGLNDNPRESAPLRSNQILLIRKKFTERSETGVTSAILRY